MSGSRVASRSAIGALGVAALGALVLIAGGVDPIEPAAARDASPLGFLAAGPVSTMDSKAEAPALGDAFPTAPDRLGLVFSLSEAAPRDIRPISSIGRLLTLASARSGVAREAEWQEATVAPDRPITVTPRYAPAIKRIPTPREVDSPPPPESVLKPRKLARTGTNEEVPSVVLKPTTWVASADAVIARFESIGYDLDRVRIAAGPVPRFYLEAMPRDLSNMPSARAKKRFFFQAVLPIVLQVNEEIATARWRVERLGHRLARGDALAPADRAWLVAMADGYGADPLNVRELLTRMDVVPPSLALAQAAEETGWGTSRFAREGNALFGQYTYNGTPGMVPARRDSDRRHRVRSYDNLLAGVRAYVHNLNSHWAYEDFRRRRAELRRDGVQISGYALAGELQSYSERRGAYVKSIRQIIRQNRLGDFDRAWLNNRQWTAVIGPPSRRPPI